MTLEIRVYAPDDLPPTVRYQILSFLRVWDTVGFVGRWRGRRWISRPEFNPIHVVLMDDDFVVAHAEVVSGAFQHNDIEYTAYGLSAVFVYPDYRGLGHGVGIVQSATETIIQQSDADIGLLWCAPELREFYLRSGWAHQVTAITLLGDTREQAKVHDTEILFMRFFSDKGSQHQADFQTIPLYFGWTTW
jgi:GNAT superfamily N-acetyltransferase